MKLFKKDYENILNYYNDTFDKNNNIKELKRKVENIIANKLCRCIKKVNNRIKDDNYSIAICKNSVLTKKNLKIKGFNCKKKITLKYDKKQNGLFKKTKNLTLKIKKIKKINY